MRLPTMAERRRFSDLPGLTAVAATYVYFLIWAQFGLLARMHAAGLDAGSIRVAMAAMGVAGLAASFAAARLPAGRRSVAAGLAGCAVAALGSLAASSLAGFAIAAAAVGAATAIATVALASALPQLVAPGRRGLAVGAATGLAYLICNLPILFEASPAVQAIAAASLCLLASMTMQLSGRADGAPTPLPGAPARRHFHGLGWAAVVAAFLALVWLDSAAFAIIQESETLRQLTWAPGNIKLLLGAVHLVAALAAGWIVDRGGLLSLPFPAFVALALAALLLDRLAPALAAGVLYAAGVSLYSVALVLAPGARLDDGLAPPGQRAAQLYGVAGWIGSAAGVGMAQDLHRIPGAFLVAAGALLAVAGAIGAGTGALRLARRALPSLALAALGGLTALAWPVAPAASSRLPAPASSEEQERATAIARGRAVYVAEGCIHCHSQFVRPQSRDERLWGPARPLDRSERPPLVGNRRQGPDLAAVGLRRSPVWNRLHLLDPRALTPASRMPSYAHLFARPAGPGDDLVEYLASLGAGDGEARLALLAAAAEPTPDMEPTSMEPTSAGGLRYRELCAACHGTDGRADGPLAEHFPRAVLDLAKPRLNHLANRADGSRDPGGLTHLIRWGAPGTSMAGHETLSRREVAELAAAVAAFAPQGPASDLSAERP